MAIQDPKRLEHKGKVIFFLEVVYLLRL